MGKLSFYPYPPILLLKVLELFSRNKIGGSKHLASENYSLSASSIAVFAYFVWDDATSNVKAVALFTSTAETKNTYEDNI
jgi:hypothetical protein